MHGLPIALRAPILGFGLGAVAGGFEAVKVGATVKLALDLQDALLTGAVTVLLDGLLGGLCAVPFGLLLTVVGRKWGPARRAGLSMTGAALLLALWFLGHAAADLHAQGRTVAAIAFLVMPLPMAGVVWFNAYYWLRREEMGERRRFGWWAVSLCIAGVLVLGGALSAAGRSFGAGMPLASDPNVVIVTIDTLRRDHISAYGEAPVPGLTPVMDRLAQEGNGILFRDAITPFPETAPAHAALFTGRHPVRNGVLSNGHRLEDGYLTLAEVLRKEGYATGAFVSSFAVDSRTGLDQGFAVYDDDFFPWVRALSEILVARWGLRAVMRFLDPTDFPFLLERPAPVTYGRALEWIGANRTRPFLAWVHLFEPHSPYEPHGLPGFEDNGTPGAPSVDHRTILSDESKVTYDEALVAKLRRLYAEEVAYTDQQLGLFLEALDGLKLDRPLLLVVTADHGEMLGEHDIYMNHHGIYDDALSVPLIIVPPTLRPKSRTVDAQVRLMDVSATVLDQLKLDPMEDSEGLDLVSYAEGIRDKSIASLLMGRRTASLSEGTLCGYRASATTEDGARTTKVKYILDPGAGTEALYDLAADPDETTSLGSDWAGAVAQLRERVQIEGEACRDFVPPVQSAAEIEALKALGYVE